MSRDGQSTRFTYDANSNRLSRMEIANGDTDLEGQFDAPGFSLTTSETPQVDAVSNRLLGFSLFTTTNSGTGASTSSAQVQYTVDANGAMTSDGQRTFVYDASNRLVKVEASKGGDAAGVEYLHNALGQRVFKSNPVTESTSSLQDNFSSGFIGWLKSNFGWMFAPGQQGKSRLGLAFVYDEQGSLIAAYSNGSSTAATQQMEIIWLPLEDGGSIPVGVFKNGNFYAVHTDHLGTPRLVTDSAKTPVWQWPYSGFGNNKPTGVLATITTRSASGATTTQLKGTTPALEFNLRFPGQYFDSESNLAYNYFRSYLPGQGRYTQADPIGLIGGLSRFTYTAGNPLRYSDPDGRNPFAGALGGAEFGAEAGSIFGPVGSAIGGALGAGIGAWLGWNVVEPMFAKPPENAYQPDGPKAPGKPSDAEGFNDPKGGASWVPNPNPGKGGSSYGWKDDRGRVWCPTGQSGRAHGGPHWDVQWPDGSHSNVPPGTNIDDL